MKIYLIFAVVVIIGARDQWFPVFSEFAYGLCGWGGGDSWSTEPVTQRMVLPAKPAHGWRSMARAA